MLNDAPWTASLTVMAVTSWCFLFRRPCSAILAFAHWLIATMWRASHGFHDRRRHRLGDRRVNALQPQHEAAFALLRPVSSEAGKVAAVLPIEMDRRRRPLEAELLSPAQSRHPIVTVTDPSPW